MPKPNAALDTGVAHVPTNRDRASRALVCLALMLALTTLLCRIASVW
jgi:hypothetical protein